uniref:UPAR/Ly6 domain-containing protein n=1 Tax=Cynoglossus semilaevis TaxID=244447 RepID=A0A3P8VGZ2_CYNSE
MYLHLLLYCPVSSGEALRCYCGGRHQCPGGVETCRVGDDVCSSITYTIPSPSFTKRCSNTVFCKFLSDSPLSTGTCCNTDLCNV